MLKIKQQFFRREKDWFDEIKKTRRSERLNTDSRQFLYRNESSN